MANLKWVDGIPLLAWFALSIGLVLTSIWIGTRVAGRSDTEGTAKDGESVGSVVGAMLGLLAFLLAFTFSMTADRYNVRKQLLLDETNAIGTLYLRIGLLPESLHNEARALLRRYVDLRVHVAQGLDPNTLANQIAESESIQKKLWSQVQQLAASQPPTVFHSLYTQALNEVIDLHSERLVVATQHRVPIAIWLALYVVAILAMIVVGYQFGKFDRRRLVVGAILAVAFSTVLTLIADLDRGHEGNVRLSQQPMFDLQRSMTETN